MKIICSALLLSSHPVRVVAPVEFSPEEEEYEEKTEEEEYEEKSEEEEEVVVVATILGQIGKNGKNHICSHVRCMRSLQL